jgi:AmpD protein
LTYADRRGADVGEGSANAIGNDGRHALAEWVASPNFDARPAGTKISLLVIHNISLPPGEFGGEGIFRLFTNTLDSAAHPYYATLSGLRVSSHFLVRRDGALVQFVSCLDRAWHAGVSSWCGRERCNDFSIGVELEGTDDHPYADAQYRALAELTRALRQRHPISDIAGHAEISPGRKTDPGPAFDWLRYRGLLEI